MLIEIIGLRLRVEVRLYHSCCLYPGMVFSGSEHSKRSMAGCLDWSDVLAAHFGAVSHLFPLSAGLRSDKAEWDVRVEGLYGHGVNLAMGSMRLSRERVERIEERVGRPEAVRGCVMLYSAGEKGRKMNTLSFS